MRKLNKLAFTLIELLVVITIIGILATGATTVYTSQIQKARDATRLTDINAVKSWVEQFYQDDWEYPLKWPTFSWVTVYVPKLPQDPKITQAHTHSVFEYFYNTGQDNNGILGQVYEISTTFENSWSRSKKAWKDGWDDDNRMEIGINIDWNNTNGMKTAVSRVGWIPETKNKYDCIKSDWSDWNCTDDADPMLIRN